MNFFQKMKERVTARQVAERYEAEVIKLRSEGMTYPNIHKIITEKGYKGSVASLLFQLSHCVFLPL